MQRDESEPGKEGNRAAPDLPSDGEAQRKRKPMLFRRSKIQIAKDRTHLAIHRPCHTECIVSKSFHAREESLLHISVVMAIYHGKCGEDGWRPSTFMLWLNAEPGGEGLPHVIPSGGDTPLFQVTCKNKINSIEMTKILLQ
jgi:hypothetical protein